MDYLKNITVIVDFTILKTKLLDKNRIRPQII